MTIKIMFCFILVAVVSVISWMCASESELRESAIELIAKSFVFCVVGALVFAIRKGAYPVSVEYFHKNFERAE